MSSPMPDNGTITNGLLKGRVTHIIDPSNFWMQIGLDSMFEKFEELESSINEFCERAAIPNTTLDLEQIQDERVMVLAKCPTKNKWCRAYILRDCGNDNADVLFIDYAHADIVSSNSILTELLPEFSVESFSGFARRCCLLGIKPIAKNWTRTGIKTFRESALEKKFIVIIGKSEQTFEFQVALFDENTQASLTHLLLKQEIGLEHESIEGIPEFWDDEHLINLSDVEENLPESPVTPDTPGKIIPAPFLSPLTSTVKTTPGELKERSYEKNRKVMMYEAEKLKCEGLDEEARLYLNGKQEDLSTFSRSTSLEEDFSDISSQIRAAESNYKKMAGEVESYDDLSVLSDESTYNKLDTAPSETDERDFKRSLDEVFSDCLNKDIESVWDIVQVHMNTDALREERKLELLLKSVLEKTVDESCSSDLALMIMDIYHCCETFSSNLKKILQNLLADFVKVSKKELNSKHNVNLGRLFGKIFLNCCLAWSNEHFEDVKKFIIFNCEKWIIFNKRGEVRDCGKLLQMYTEIFEMCWMSGVCETKTFLPEQYFLFVDEMKGKILAERIPMDVKLKVLNLLIWEMQHKPSTADEKCQTEQCLAFDVSCQTEAKTFSKRCKSGGKHEKYKAILSDDQEEYPPFLSTAPGNKLSKDNKKESNSSANQNEEYLQINPNKSVNKIPALMSWAALVSLTPNDVNKAKDINDTKDCHTSSKLTLQTKQPALSSNFDSYCNENEHLNQPDVKKKSPSFSSPKVNTNVPKLKCGMSSSTETYKTYFSNQPVLPSDWKLIGTPDSSDTSPSSKSEDISKSCALKGQGDWFDGNLHISQGSLGTKQAASSVKAHQPSPRLVDIASSFLSTEDSTSGDASLNRVGKLTDEFLSKRSVQLACDKPSDFSMKVESKKCQLDSHKTAPSSDSSLLDTISKTMSILREPSINQNIVSASADQIDEVPDSWEDFELSDDNCQNSEQTYSPLKSDEKMNTCSDIGDLIEHSTKVPIDSSKNSAEYVPLVRSLNNDEKCYTTEESNKVVPEEMLTHSPKHLSNSAAEFTCPSDLGQPNASAISDPFAFSDPDDSDDGFVVGHDPELSDVISEDDECANIDYTDMKRQYAAMESSDEEPNVRLNEEKPKQKFQHQPESKPPTRRWVPGKRTCTACGSADHLVYDCKDRDKRFFNS